MEETKNQTNSPEYCEDLIQSQKFSSNDYQQLPQGRLRYSIDPLFKHKSKSIVETPQVTFPSSNGNQIDQIQASLVN